MRLFRIFSVVLCGLLGFGFISPASAQIQTYFYTGPAWDVSQCQYNTGYSSPPCINGHTSGSFSFNIPDNYTGAASPSQAVSWSLNATGVGQLGTGNELSGVGFVFYNGQITDWNFGAEEDPSGNTPIISTYHVDNSVTAEQAWNRIGSGPDVSGYGYYNYNPGGGFWTNGKTLGIACADQAPADSRPPSGGVGCAAPISLGSGNMYEWAQDYSTAGQNPLSFTRYYNSMSMPDTYAVGLGSNWRHNFDRYLHIINPSAIYGAVAERADGQYVSFSSASGTYTSDTDLDYNLTKSGSTWTLTAPDDTVETYAQTAGEATLSTIKLRNGYTLTMHYTSGKLTSVTDTYGRTLTLSYTGSLLTGLTTPDSANLTYGYVAYSSSNRLTTVTYNTSPATHITYLYENTSYPFALTGITDENNKRYATWAYDGQGRAVSSQLAGGINFTSVTYDDATGNRLVQGPLGIIETYKFSMLQGVPKVTEIDRAANGTVAFASRGFSYDSNGYTKTETDWNGNQTAYTNNSHGLPTQIVYASGSTVSHTTSITYDSTWARLAHVITTPGTTATLNYSATNGTLLTRVLADTTSTSVPYSTNGQTRTWTFTYTSTGQLATAQLPRTDVTAKTTYTYTGGVLTNIKDALNHNTQIVTYKPGGLPLTIRDPNNTLTTLAYSPRLWLTSSVLTTSSGNLTTGLQYDSAGNLTKATLPDNSSQSYTYNDAHQLTKITNALSESANFTYNSAGNLTQTLWKNAGGTTKRQHTATFDALGRIRTDVGGVSQTTTYGYDSNGNVTGITDPLSHVTTQTFDALNRLKTTKNAVKDLVQFTYNAHDLPLTVTDGKGNATSFVYDGFNEAISQVSPDSGTSVFWFDKDGNVSKQSAFAITNYTYDALDRLLTRTYPADSTLNVSLTYDQTTGHGSGVGRLTSATDQAGSLSLAYEQRGLVTSNARTISATAYTTGYTYESAGRLASVTYPTAAWAVKYARDAAGQVSGVTVKPPSTSAVNLATSVTHYPFGPVAGFTYGNGLVSTRTYDLDYRMTNVTDTTPTVQNLTFAYNAGNNITGITDAVTTANNQTLTYDEIDRLKTASGSYGSVSSITYDSNSNRKTYGGTSYTIPSTSNKMSAIGATSITYSSTGNITGIGTTPTFTWNKVNQMATAVVSGTTSTYLYGFDGMRQKITVGAGTPTVTQYDQSGNLLTETNSGTETDYAWLDGMPIAAIQPAASTVSAIHTNNLGTPQKATNTSKTVVFTCNYDPNGKCTPTTSIIQNLRFPGMYADASGFNRNGVRDNNPNYATGGGRQLEVDLIGLGGGMNPYVYAGQNTYKWTDRLGLDQAPPGYFDLYYNNPSALDPQGAMFGFGFLAAVALPEMLAAGVPEAAAAGEMCRVGTEVPRTLARVIPGEGPFSTLGLPGQPDVFVTDPAAIEGLSPAQIAQRLTIRPSNTFTVVEFPTPTQGVASPVFRTNFGFIGGGRTAGGAPEFVVPNGPIPQGAIIRIIGQ